MNNIGKVLWGIVLIVIGIIIGTNSFGITDINLFFKGWWTLFIIIPCTIDLFSEKTNKKANLLGVLIGIFILLISNGLINIEIIAKLILPIVFVGIGISLIFNNTLKKEISDKVNKKNKNDLEFITAAFSEQKIIKEDEKFEGAQLDSVFGNIILDLKKAELSKETIIKASSIFGGINIITPKNVEIKIKSTPIFGTVKNKIEKEKNTKDKENKKTIYIEAFCLFGGIDIK